MVIPPGLLYRRRVIVEAYKWNTIVLALLSLIEGDDVFTASENYRSVVERNSMFANLTQQLVAEAVLLGGGSRMNGFNYVP